jgi:multiple sugar transport system permease protein
MSPFMALRDVSLPRTALVAMSGPLLLRCTVVDLLYSAWSLGLTFISSTENKTVPVAIVNEFVDGNIYRWGSLMAGALVGSLPLVILYAFFVEHYVSAMTGAVKE